MPESTGQQSHTSLTAGDYLEKALAWSKQVRREVKCDLDVPYGNDDRQKLDVYMPENAGSAGTPVLMFLHGGYWVLGHKDTLRQVDAGLLAATPLAMYPHLRE